MDDEPLIIEDSQQGIFRVRRSVYTDPRLLDLERQRIFSRCWLYAGHESEVRAPGEFRTRSIAGRRVILVRDRAGELRILLNTCSHRGAQVCLERSGTAKLFRCPYHFWSFNTDGTLRGVSDEAAYGRPLNREELGLPRVRTESYRGFLFVNFDGQAEPLREYLGKATEFIDVLCEHSEVGLEIVGGTHEWTARSNWKLLVENSVDSYHAVRLHLRYLNMTKGSSRGSFKPSGYARDFGNGHAGIEFYPSVGPRPIADWGPPYPPELKPECEAIEKRFIERLGAEAAFRVTKKTRVLLLFPNTLIHDASGGVSIRTCYPADGPESLNASAWTVAPVDESPRMRQARLETFVAWFGPGGMVMPDDGEVLESLQRSLVGTDFLWTDNSRGMLRDGERLRDDELQHRAFWRQWHARVAPDSPPLVGTG